MVWTEGARRVGESECTGARSMPALAMGALVLAAVCLAIPLTPAPQSQMAAAPTTAPLDGVDAGDALAALFAGIAAGSLLFSYENGRARRSG